MKYSFAIFLPLYAVYSAIVLITPGDTPFWITAIVSFVIGVVSGHLGAVIERNKRAS